MKKIQWLLPLLVVLSACGYQATGLKSTGLPEHIQSLAIPMFENESNEPVVQRPLTEALRRAFINDGRLRLAGENRADLVMKGTLTRYSIRAVSFNANDIATEYWVYLNVTVKVTDRAAGTVHLDQKLRTRWDYRASSSVVSSEVSRQEALSQAYRDLGAWQFLRLMMFHLPDHPKLPGDVAQPAADSWFKRASQARGFQKNLRTGQEGEPAVSGWLSTVSESAIPEYPPRIYRWFSTPGRPETGCACLSSIHRR